MDSGCYVRGELGSACGDSSKCQGLWRRGRASAHHEAAAEVKGTTAGSAETAETNYERAEAEEACSRQRAERAAS